MPFQFPVDLAKRLAETWLSTQSRGYMAPPLPVGEQLRTLLEVAYLAGMEEDKGRPARFLLCWTAGGRPRSTQTDFEVDGTRRVNAADEGRVALFPTPVKRRGPAKPSTATSPGRAAIRE